MKKKQRHGWVWRIKGTNLFAGRYGDDEYVARNAVPLSKAIVAKTRDFARSGKNDNEVVVKALLDRKGRPIRLAVEDYVGYGWVLYCSVLKAYKGNTDRDIWRIKKLADAKVFETRKLAQNEVFCQSDLVIKVLLTKKGKAGKRV